MLWKLRWLSWWQWNTILLVGSGYSPKWEVLSKVRTTLRTFYRQCKRLFQTLRHPRLAQLLSMDSFCNKSFAWVLPNHRTSTQGSVELSPLLPLKPFPSSSSLNAHTIYCHYIIWLCYTTGITVTMLTVTKHWKYHCSFQNILLAVSY